MSYVVASIGDGAVDNREATEKFKLSQKLYAKKQYTEALAVLDELNEAFPDSKNIMYPRALCLAKLGQFADADAVCQQLVAVFGDERAKKLLQKIKPHLQESTAFDPMDLSDLGDVSGQGDLVAPMFDPKDSVFGVQARSSAVPVAGIPVEDEKTGFLSGKGVYIAVGAGLAIFLAVGVGLAIFGPEPPPAPASGEGGQVTAASERPTMQQLGTGFVVRLVLLVLAVFAALVASLYVTLMLTEKLPDNAFPYDLIHVTGFTFLSVLLWCVCPCIGIFVAGFMLRKVYDMDLMTQIVHLTVSFFIVVPAFYVLPKYIFPEDYMEYFVLGMGENIGEQMGVMKRGTIPEGVIFLDGMDSDWYNVPDFLASEFGGRYKLAQAGSDLYLGVTLRSRITPRSTSQSEQDMFYMDSMTLGSVTIGDSATASLQNPESMYSIELSYKTEDMVDPLTGVSAPTAVVKCEVNRVDEYGFPTGTILTLDSTANPEELAHSESFIELKMPMSTIGIAPQTEVVVAGM